MLRQTLVCWRFNWISFWVYHGKIVICGFWCLWRVLVIHLCVFSNRCFYLFRLFTISVVAVSCVDHFNLVCFIESLNLILFFLSLSQKWQGTKHCLLLCSLVKQAFLYDFFGVWNLSANEVPFFNNHLANKMKVDESGTKNISGLIPSEFSNLGSKNPFNFHFSSK